MVWTVDAETDWEGYEHTDTGSSFCDRVRPVRRPSDCGGSIVTPDAAARLITKSEEIGLSSIDIPGTSAYNMPMTSKRVPDMTPEYRRDYERGWRYSGKGR